MIFLKDNKFSCNFNNAKKEIIIKVKKATDINEELQNYVNTLRKKYEDFSFFLTIDDKFKLDNLNLNNLYKLSDHLKQNVKVLVYVINVDERKTKTGDFMYTIKCEIPGKKKYVDCKMFSKNIQAIQKGSFYIINGKVVEGNSQYIKKNEKELGKVRDLSIMINSLEKYEHIEKIEKNKYATPRQELHAHTMFSKNDGFITSKDIKIAFEENKVDQIALTDHGAVFAFIPFSNDLKNDFKDSGKRLLLGSEFYSVDTTTYDNDTQAQIYALEEEVYSLKNGTANKDDLEFKEERLKIEREKRDSFLKITKRKTVTEEERASAKAEYDYYCNEIANTSQQIKDIKALIKNEDALIISKEQEIEKLRTFIGRTHEIPRDHLTVIVKSKDEEMEYRGEKIKYNPGIVALYKLISKSYLEYFSAPTTPALKMYGKRPTIPYHELFKEGVREHFVINSACAFGKHMKLAIDSKWEEFKQWVKQLDAVEIQPMHNNIYMVNHHDYPTITCEDDVKKLHQEIYKHCKEVGTKVIFTSDAHVNNKEDRDLRSVFKSGYISAIKSRVEESRLKKIARGEEVEPEQSGGDDDFSVDTQPYILSYDDAVQDLANQGFSEEQIKEIMDNTKAVADECSNAFEITVLPKKMFLGDFPGVNVKEEIPKLTWEAAIAKYSKDGTKETIDEKIKERIETELDAIKTTGYEILYYIAYWSCRKSEEMGYTVGSRGSAGSMIVTYLLSIGENNPLDPHYFCPKCKKIEWVETDVVGLDLPTKVCECGTEMENDGCAIESHNFLGWGLTKAADIDLNFSSVVQTEVHKAMIEVFGEENMIKSGTQSFYQENKIKSDIFKHIPNIREKVQNEEFDIDYYAHAINTMSTTGQHPGGLLLKPSDIPFELVTPLVYVSDDLKKGEVSSFVDYHSIEDQLPKIDALGHSDPTMLKELKDFTGIDYKTIKFNDPKMYEAILDPTFIGIKKEDFPFPSTTMAISEMNSDFTMKVLAEIKPKNITDMIYFSGLTHGTAVYQDNLQRELILEGKPLHEVIPVRDIIFQQLVKKYNFDPAEAFTISESVRKGKGIKKWEKELREKCPHWYVEVMAQIKYLFPKAHALSYVMAAMRCYWYKLNEPTAFYASALNRYGVENNDNKNLDYTNIYNSLNTKDDLARLHKYYEHASDNPTKIKNNQRIASIIYEAKLRGIKLVPADFSSAAAKFSPDRHNEKHILCPLTSIKGVGGSGADTIVLAYDKFGDSILKMNREELETLKVEKDGKEVKAFGKKVLDAVFGEN